MKLTKIVATLSDKRCDPDFIRALYHAGMNVVRINSAHATPESFALIVDSVRQVSQQIAIMLDTKGPEIRTTVLADGAHSLPFEQGDMVNIIGDPDQATTHDTIFVNYRDIAHDVRVGQHVLIDDGTLDFKIESITDGVIRAEACNTADLGSRKTINIPGAKLDLPALSARDREFIKLACEANIDFIAHSFVRRRSDVETVQHLLDSYDSKIRIIAKIENQEGVDHFDDILSACYGIMIARGDLGIEVPAERIPAIQRSMISKCIAAHKPVIVATQMLHSMIHSPRPTRAEVTDVSEAAYQRADALMLSGETAAGRYPVEAVETMARIVAEVERGQAATPEEAPRLPDNLITSFLARQAVMSQVKIGTCAIITDSFHGTTARFIASFRGPRPVFAVCDKLCVARRLALSYGISPYYYPEYTPDQRYPIEAMKQIIQDQHLHPDDRIAYLGTNGGNGAAFLEINNLADLLAGH